MTGFGFIRGRKKSTIDRALGFLWAASELGCGLAIIDNLQKLGIGHNDNDAQNDAFEQLCSRSPTIILSVCMSSCSPCSEAARKYP